MDECLAGYPPAFHFFPFWWPTSTSAIGILVKTMSRCQMAVGLKSKTWSGARRGRSQASTACRWKGCWSCQWAQPKDFIWGGKIQGFWRKKIENKLKMNIEFPGILVNIFDEGRNSLSLLLFLLIIRVANQCPDHQGRRPNNEDRAAHRTVSCPWEGVRPVHIFTVRTRFIQVVFALNFLFVKIHIKGFGRARRPLCCWLGQRSPSWGEKDFWRSSVDFGFVCRRSRRGSDNWSCSHPQVRERMFIENNLMKKNSFTCVSEILSLSSPIFILHSREQKWETEAIRGTFPDRSWVRSQVSQNHKDRGRGEQGVQWEGGEGERRRGGRWRRGRRGECGKEDVSGRNCVELKREALGGIAKPGCQGKS